MSDPSRERETRELLDRFREARARRRRARLLAVIIGSVVLIAAVTGVTLAVASGRGDPAGRPATTSSSVTQGGPAPGSTTAPPPTTVPEDTSTSTIRAETTTTSVRHVTSSSTTKPPRTTTTAPTPAPAPQPRWVVVIDPGHQAQGDSRPEPIGPGSDQTKPRVSSGTRGVATGIPESQLVLAVSLKLRDALDAAGVEVIMTRTTQEVSLSNIERAQIANQAQADLFLRVHADGADDSATAGIHVLYPAAVPGWTDDIAAVSKQAAAIAQRELIAATGAKDRGIDARDDMTGFNWSDVPVILPEIGFMTNPSEDRLLATPEYQDAIAGALARAVVRFLQGG